MFHPHIFRANDIRGRYLKDFDLAFTKDLAHALCLLAKQKGIHRPKFLLGRDARLSGPEIARGLLSRLKARGAGVCSIGLAPSPLCYFLLERYKLTACVVVTASHNPPEDNGFKILFRKKSKIPRPIPLLKKIILSQNPRFKKAPGGKGYSFKIEKFEPYIASLKKEFPRLKNIPFALDTGNGALGPLAKKAYSALGLKPKILCARPDGRFPSHHPDPTAEKNLVCLKKALGGGGFELGFGFDGDGDRLAVITKGGQTVLGDDLGFLLLKCLAANRARPPLVLADVKCSDRLFREAKKQGLRAKMTKSGHGLIRERMEKTGAKLAVEFSGHIFFNDRKGRGFDDALYASLRLLEFLSAKEAGLSSFLPKSSFERTGEIRLPMPLSLANQKLSKIQALLKRRGDSFKKIDGIRLKRGESWALFRGSQTQSALTMRFEAPSKKKLKLLKREFSKALGLKIP